MSSEDVELLDELEEEEVEEWIAYGEDEFPDMEETKEFENAPRFENPADLFQWMVYKVIRHIEWAAERKQHDKLTLYGYRMRLYNEAKTQAELVEEMMQKIRKQKSKKERVLKNAERRLSDIESNYDQEIEEREAVPEGEFEFFERMRKIHSQMNRHRNKFVVPEKNPKTVLENLHSEIQRTRKLMSQIRGNLASLNKEEGKLAVRLRRSKERVKELHCTLQDTPRAPLLERWAVKVRVGSALGGAHMDVWKSLREKGDTHPQIEAIRESDPELVQAQMAKIFVKHVFPGREHLIGQGSLLEPYLGSVEMDELRVLGKNMPVKTLEHCMPQDPEAFAKLSKKKLLILGHYDEAIIQSIPLDQLPLQEPDAGKVRDCIPKPNDDPDGTKKEQVITRLTQAQSYLKQHATGGRLRLYTQVPDDALKVMSTDEIFGLTDNDVIHETLTFFVREFKSGDAEDILAKLDLIDGKQRLFVVKNPAILLKLLKAVPIETFEFLRDLPIEETSFYTAMNQGIDPGIDEQDDWNWMREEFCARSFKEVRWITEGMTDLSVFEPDPEEATVNEAQATLRKHRLGLLIQKLWVKKFKDGAGAQSEILRLVHEKPELLEDDEAFGSIMSRRTFTEIAVAEAVVDFPRELLEEK